PSVKFIGHVSPEVFYNQVDFVIVPSLWHEPLARTVFESYFYGLPVIGSNRGGIPESIVNGVNGFIFDPDNPNSLSDSIKLLAYDDEVYEKMSNNAISMSKKFDIETTVNNYVALYQEVING
ncbi:TPA: glycosyltransferase, partial [Escherichia coli]|nr:glycosyltransferase [Escherichia coli]HBN7276560.1 glycosyltransferase [Escherichia coli]HEA1273375.1 glycosyltransferase [Escherichia coli]